MAEQVHPYTNASLSVSPLTWSHAALVATVLKYLEKRSKPLRCSMFGQPFRRAEVVEHSDAG